MWFSSKCAIEQKQKVAIDQAMAWLIDRLGTSIILEGKVITPTRDSFPNIFTRRVADLSELFDRVCIYMRLDPDRVQVRFVNAAESVNNLGGDVWLHHDGSTAAGTYENEGRKQVVSIMLSAESDQTSVIATMVHELAHVHLIGGKHVDTFVDDHEPVTDLATVYFGMGIFNANSACQYNQFGSGWSTRRLGYLSDDEFGYAFALYAYLRNEARPRWARHLRGNISDAMRRSLKYLHNTRDCEINLNKPGDYARMPKQKIDDRDHPENPGFGDRNSRR